MAQPLRCDEHPEVAGALLVQNLVAGEVRVACPECMPEAVRGLAEATGVAAEIWEAAQAALMAEAAEAAEKRERAAARKGGRKQAQPQDTGTAGESTDPALPISTESMVAPEAEGALPEGYADEHGR